MPVGGGDGDPGDLETLQQCILNALSESLTGEEFVEYLLACLCEHDIIECD